MAKPASRTVRRSDAPAAAVQAAPPFAALWAALVYLVCALVLIHPAFSGQFLVNPMSDQLSATAYRVFSAQVWQESGGFPHWNPYILGGIPFIAAQHGDIFYPTFLLRAFLPADVTLTWSFGLHFFLCGLFTYGLMRALKFGFFPSLLAGLAYMLSGQITSLVSPGHDGKVYVSTIAPLILWMILIGMRDGRVWAWGMVALATGLSILSPHFQMTYYLGLLAIGFTFFLAFHRGEWQLEPKVRLTRLAFAAGAAALGFLIASIHFLPFFDYIPFSPRAEGGRGYEYATSYSMPPEELFNVYLPQFSGMLDAYWGRTFFKLHGEYLGAAVLVLAGLAFANAARRRLMWFWIGAAIVTLLVAFGGYTPFYRLVYELPMMSVVRAPNMSFFVATLAVAGLTAIGVERLLAGEVSRRYLIGWAGAAAAIALLATVGGLTGLAAVLAGPERIDAAEANRTAMVLGAWRSFLFVALTVGAIWAYQLGRVPARAIGWVIAAIIAIDLWSVNRTFFRFMPPASELYGSDQAIEYLKARSDSGRTVALPLADLEARGDAVLGGDALMVHEVRTVTGHQGNELQRWVDLAGAKSPAPPNNVFHPQFRKLANVKYLLTNADLPESAIPGVRLIKRVGPVRNAAGNPSYVYELDEANPPAWVAPVIVEAPADAIGGTVTDPRFDVTRAALFDSTDAVTGVQPEALPEPVGIRATVSRPAPNRISVALDQPAPEGSALIVSENYYPGWRAEVDGKATPAARAQYTLIGVPLPEGARAIELTFIDPAFARGKLLSLVALTLTALLIIGGIVLDRRRRV